ncbi:MAG: tripartite tricarboxylate transporter substrate binding protein [Burkholderiales bacterium]
MNRLIAALVLCIAATAMPAGAQEYPSRPIKLVVVAPAGGTADNVARILAAKMSEKLGQQVVVENRPSNAGIVGYEMVARSPADGYTLLMATGTLSTVQALYPNVTFDAVKDFEPVSWVLTTPYVVVAHPSVPVSSMKELVAYAKANPGKLSYSGGTVGAQQHLSGELLKRSNGIDMLYVPYKGSGAMLPDLLSGRVDIAIDNVLLLTQYINKGQVKGLAVTGATRSPILPDLPTVAEAGTPGFQVIGWFGVFAPAKTPQAIVRKLNADIASIMKQPDVADPLLKQGAEPQSGSPEDLRRLLDREIAMWGKVIKEANIKAE